MKKNLTRVLALAMALLMCLSLLPVSALAGDADFAAMIASAQAAQAAAMGGTAPDVPFVMPEQALDYTDPNVCLASEDGQHLWIEVHDPAYICAWGDCTEENPHILYKSCAYCKQSAEPLYANELEAIQIEAQVFAETQEEIPPEQYDDWDYRAYHKYIFELPDHFYEKQDGQAPTCTAGGHTAYEQCSVCEEIRGYEELDPLGHNWGEYTVTVEPTCTAAGTKMRECLRCGEKEYADIPALGHDWGEFVTVKEPTCTETGTTKRVCERCGAEDFGEIPANGHSYGDFTILKEATCTEDGSKEHTCAVCEYKETVVIPAAHTWGDFTVTKEATCTEAGEQEHTCTVCDVTETVAIPAKDHSYGEDGVCTVCGAEKPAEPAVEEPTVEEPVVEDSKEEESKEEESEKEPAGAQPVGAIVEDCRDMYSSFGAFLAEQNAADAKYVVASYTPVDANGHALGEIPAGGVRFDLPLPEGADAASVQVYTYDYSTYSWSPANFFLSDGSATVSSGAYPYPPFAVLAAPAASGNGGETTPTKQEASSEETVNEFKDLMDEKGISADDPAGIVAKKVTPLREDGTEMSNEEVAAQGGVTFEMDLPENYEEGDELEFYHKNSETGEWELVTDFEIKGNKVIIHADHFSDYLGFNLTKGGGTALRGSGGTGIPELADLKLDGTEGYDVKSAFVGDILHPVIPASAGTPSDYTYQWYRITPDNVETKIPASERGQQYEYTVQEKDLDNSLACAAIKKDSAEVEHSERSESLRVRKIVNFRFVIKGEGTVTYKKVDEIVETHVKEGSFTEPTDGTFNVLINDHTITGDTLTFTVTPKLSNGFVFRSYSNNGAKSLFGGTFTEVTDKTVTDPEAAKVTVPTFTLTASEHEKVLTIIFDKPNVYKGPTGSTDEDTYDYQHHVSKDKLKTLTDGMGLTEDKVGTITYVSPTWDSDSKLLDASQIEDYGGVDFELPLPTGYNAATDSIRVYHYDGEWNLVPVSFYTVTGTAVEVNNYKDFSPFVALALTSVQLSFNAGEGSGSMTTRNYAQGEKVKAPAPASTLTPPTGQVFSCWSGSDGNTYYEGDEITMSDDIELTAQWGYRAVIKFTPGDGSGVMGEQKAIIGDSTTLAKNAFDPPSENFVPGGWKDELGKAYAEEGDITPDRANITLTAQWTRTKYTVTYDKNGGGGTMNTQTTDLGKTVKLSDCTFNPIPDTHFVEWNEDPTGEDRDTAYDPGESVSFDDDVTLYAIWRKPLTVNYDRGEGNGASQSFTVDEGIPTNLTTVKELKFTGPDAKPQFAGWKDDDGNTYEDGEEITLTADKSPLNLTAQWAEKVTVTFEPNGATYSTKKTQSIPKDTDTKLMSKDEIGYNYTGYEFKGWAKYPNVDPTTIPPYEDGKTYADGGTVNFSTDTPLYAIWEKHDFTGTVTITGEVSGTDPVAYVGETLSAKVSGEKVFTTYTYLWKANGVPIEDENGAPITTETYIVQPDDFNKTITCDVTATEVGQTKTSNSKVVSIDMDDKRIVSSPYGLVEADYIAGLTPDMTYSINGVDQGTVPGIVMPVTQQGTYRFYKGGAYVGEVEVENWYTVGYVNATSSNTTTTNGTSNAGSGTITAKATYGGTERTLTTSTTITDTETKEIVLQPYTSVGVYDHVWIVKQDSGVCFHLTVTPSSGSYRHVSKNNSGYDSGSTARTYFDDPVNNYAMYSIIFNRSSTSPRTADDSHLGLWSALCFMSLAGATVLLNGQRKRRKARR